MIHQDNGVSFEIPEGMKLRQQNAAGVAIYRLDHPTVRMELSVLVGEIVELTRIATPTKISYYPPEGKDGPSEADCRMLGGLFLGAVEADSTLDAGGTKVSQLRSNEATTAKGLLCIERTLLIGSVLKHVGLLFGKDARKGALVGYQCHHSSLDTVEALKRQVVDSVEIK